MPWSPSSLPVRDYVVLTGFFSQCAMLRVRGGYGICVVLYISVPDCPLYVAAGLVLELRRELAGCVGCFWT